MLILTIRVVKAFVQVGGGSNQIALLEHLRH
jgi:hypothetical protein